MKKILPWDILYIIFLSWDILKLLYYIFANKF